MRPHQTDATPPEDLWRARLSQQIDLRHPLVRLAGLIDWKGFGGALWQALSPAARPARGADPADGRAVLAHLPAVRPEGGRTLGREPVLAGVLRLGLPAAEAADRAELAGPLAPTDRPGRHRAPAARYHRRGDPRPSGQGAELGAGQRRHHGAAQGGRPSLGLAPLLPRPRDPGPPGQAPRRAAASELRQGRQEGAPGWPAATPTPAR
jgi:hypothetical protein